MGGRSTGISGERLVNFDLNVVAPQELTKAIEDGNDKQTPKMPPFKDKLAPEQIKALVDEVKALK